MPRFEDDITICGRSDDACVADVTSQIRMEKNDSFVCECLPGCFEVTHDTEISMAPLLQHAPLLSKHGLQGPNVSVIHMYYKTMFHRSQIKAELVGFTEFLCKFNGFRNSCETFNLQINSFKKIFK